jgi:hypothetical protein
MPDSASFKIVVIIFSILMGFFIHDYFFLWNEKSLERRVLSNIEKELDHGSRYISLKSATPFSWTKVCLIQSVERYWPEIDAWNINDELREVYSGYIPSPSCDDEQNDLFFIDDGIPVANIATDLCVQIPFNKNDKICFDHSAQLVFTNTLTAKNPNQPVYLESRR